MTLTTTQAYELLAKHGVYALSACDKCGAILGAVRYTRRGEAGEWCSPECRGDSEWRTTHKGGRPPKYRDDRARKNAHAQQQRGFRQRSSVTKTCQQPNESKGLAGAKTLPSTIPLAPLFPALKTACGENGGARV